MTLEAAQYLAAEHFVAWLERRVLAAARGDDVDELSVDPTGRFWLGRLAPQRAVLENNAGDRGERLEPCAIGVRIRPAGEPPWIFDVHVTMCGWSRVERQSWRKLPPVEATIPVRAAPGPAVQSFGRDAIARAFHEGANVDLLSAEVQVEFERGPAGEPVLVVSLVNITPTEPRHLADGRLFQCAMEVRKLETVPFQLEALPDSFRWDRRVIAWGLNCGIEVGADGAIRTTDLPKSTRRRPRFWALPSAEPDLKFETLAGDPITSSEQLANALHEWGEENWSSKVLDARMRREHWSETMRVEAAHAAKEFQGEVQRIRRGIELLKSDETVRRAFCGMNRAMGIAAAGKYGRWRCFQFGFLLANLECVVASEGEADVADIVWFATGGGKTETYLGLLVTAALWDRMRGKSTGITAWSRFPLRMLSLQQTQRFANALGAAELVRRDMGIEGAPFSLGFLVGSGATPNRIDPDPSETDPWDPDDRTMPERLRVLEHCPFCRADGVTTSFDRRSWRLVHLCRNPECGWSNGPLPIFVVDDEIWRFLPTVVVGTLDKAASISMQASMRGLVGAPHGMCSRAGHGFTYAKRSKRPNGCLVPDCTAGTDPLPMPEELFGPSFRLQDELHLLRDSLGAVDAHYEALYDGLQMELCGRRPKILASSATLSGYEKQTYVLYRRRARIFPQPAPSSGSGFWASDSGDVMREYIAVAPRGVTIEFAVDRLLVALQSAIRALLADPEGTCREIGIDPRHADLLVNLYGTNVVYGNTLRDLDAVMRSAETQLGDVDGPINIEPLTGRTDFAKVRETLTRLENPEPVFEERLHVLPASSMMSHGVDIDRLNTMVMLGLPLTTAEFIQSTARVGRRWPALVVVVHKIGRERDASIYRCFPQFVEQGDRFVEPIPITRRSRRVLERTLSGLEFARILLLHEPRAEGALTTARRLAMWARQHGSDLEGDELAIAGSLGFGPDELHLVQDLKLWFQRFCRNLDDPPSDAKWPTDLSPTARPMLSLRDVEQQAPVRGEDPQ